MRQCLGRRTRGQSCRSQDLDARRGSGAPRGRNDGNAPSRPWKLLHASHLLPLPSPALTSCYDSWTTIETSARPQPTSCSGSIRSDQLCSIYQARPSYPRPSPSDYRPLTISLNMSIQAKKLSPLPARRGELCARTNYRNLGVACVSVCAPSTRARAHVDLHLCASCIVYASCMCICACTCRHACVHMHRCVCVRDVCVPTTHVRGHGSLKESHTVGPALRADAWCASQVL